MTSSYEKIYSKFLGKVKDYKIASLDNNEIYGLMNEWLHGAIGDPFIRRIFTSIKFDDEIMQVDYELRVKFDDGYDEEFVCEVFAKGMVIQWLEPQVKTTVNIAQMFTGKEQKFYAQANQLSTLNSMLTLEKQSLKRYLRDHKYSEFSLNGGVNES